MILILCGKSGCGKDSIQKALIANYNYKPIVSTTSRPKRDGETDGVEYNFVSRDDFLQLIEHDDLVEYRKYNTFVDGTTDVWYYGTVKHGISNAFDYVTILDLDGAKSFLDYFGTQNCYVCYVRASDEIRRKRAENRGSFDLTEWNRRLEADNFDFSDRSVARIADTIIDNEADLMMCVDDIALADGLSSKRYEQAFKKWLTIPPPDLDHTED